LSYAGLLKSESLMSSFKNDPALQPITLAREDAGKKISAQTAALRRNPEPAIQEALTLQAR
jgi:hypothetical protein